MEVLCGEGGESEEMGMPVSAKSERAATEVLSAANQTNCPGKAFCHALRVVSLAPSMPGFEGRPPKCLATLRWVVGSQSLLLATFLLDVGRASSPGQTGSAEAPFTWRLLPLGTLPFAHILQPISTHSKESFECSDTLINPHLSLGRAALNGELVLHRHYHFLLTQRGQDRKHV